MSDLQKALALVFRRRGGRLTATDFRHTASFDLKWFPPKDAQRLLDAAFAARLVVEEGGDLQPTFDVNAVQVPLDFRPDPAVLDAPPPPRTLAARLAEAASMEEAALKAAGATERERAGGLVGEDTSLLLAARRRGVDVRPFLA